MIANQQKLRLTEKIGPGTLFLGILLFVAGVVPVTGATDDSPVISDLHLDRESAPVGYSYTIAVRIVDPQGAEDIVPRLYLLREGIETIEVPINDEGLDGDVVKGDGIFTGRETVPPSAAVGPHRFDIHALDRAGHTSNILQFRFIVLEGVEV